MTVKLHKQARTTLGMRREIQQADGTLAELAVRYKVSIDTIRKWRYRDRVEDHSHYEFDRLCALLGVGPRVNATGRGRKSLTTELFSGDVGEVLATRRFKPGEDLARTLERYAQLYNQLLLLPVLQLQTPAQAMQDWRKHKPGLFKARAGNVLGEDG